LCGETAITVEDEISEKAILVAHLVLVAMGILALSITILKRLLQSVALSHGPN
jgi:hypothetical protein